MTQSGHNPPQAPLAGEQIVTEIAHTQITHLVPLWCARNPCGDSTHFGCREPVAGLSVLT